jgi:hypothetical protein
MSCADHTPPIAPPKCDVCGVPMAYVSKLPATLAKAALLVFRCYGCRKIETAPL